MADFLIIVLLLSNLLQFYQDLRYRAIEAWILLLLVLSILTYAFLKYGFTEAGANMLLNTGVLIILILPVVLYYYAKYRKIDLFNYLGMGDLIFLLAITPLFSLFNFVAFYISGLILALILHQVFKLNKKYNGSTIPLAGFNSIFLAFVLIVNHFNWVDINDDTYYHNLLANYVFY